MGIVIIMKEESERIELVGVQMGFLIFFFNFFLRNESCFYRSRMGKVEGRTVSGSCKRTCIESAGKRERVR